MGPDERTSDEAQARPTGTVSFLFIDIGGSTRLWQEQPAARSTALARHDEFLTWPAPGAVRVRMAGHTGTAEERNGDSFGPTLNQAARVMAAAHGGQVLVSDVTRSPLHRADLVRLGGHLLKDLTGPLASGRWAPGASHRSARSVGTRGTSLPGAVRSSVERTTASGWWRSCAPGRSRRSRVWAESGRPGWPWRPRMG